MEPLEIFICWQAGLVALSAYFFTELTKRMINVLLAVKDDNDDQLTVLERIGDELRRDTVFINTLLLPACPLVFGAIAAYALPHPELMLNYMKLHTLPFWKQHVSYGVWGLICGGGSSYFYDRVRQTISAVVASKAAAVTGKEEG